MQNIIAIVVTILSIIALIAQRKIIKKYILHSLFIGFICGLSRLWFVFESGSPGLFFAFLYYGLLSWLAAWAGLCMADAYALPKIYIEGARRKIITYTILFSIIVITLNTLMLIQAARAGALPPWLANIKSVRLILSIGLQAGLIEETIFRLLSISFIIWTINRFTKSESRRVLYLWISILVSAVFFGIIHGAGAPGAIIMGIIFGYLYTQVGWLPCVIVHALGDVSSFLIALSITA